MSEELVTVSENAAKRISLLLSQENEDGLALRVSVKGGGCSGFQYAFAFDDERADDDLVLERDGATVLIDSTSQMYLAGSEIDFVEDAIGSSFQIHNPNAASSCGCGTSFSI